MTETETRAALEALIQAEADLAIAPYRGKAPPVVLRKLREVAELYYREHPQASRILEMQVRDQQLVSGDVVRVTQDGVTDAPAETGAKVRKV